MCFLTTAHALFTQVKLWRAPRFRVKEIRGKFSYVVVGGNILNIISCVWIVPGAGLKKAWMSFCISFSIASACLFEVKTFLAKKESKLDFQMKVGCYSLAFTRCVSPLLSNHTNPKHFLILPFLCHPTDCSRDLGGQCKLSLVFLAIHTFHKPPQELPLQFGTACVFFALIQRSGFIFPTWWLTCFAGDGTL